VVLTLKSAFYINQITILQLTDVIMSFVLQIHSTKYY